MVLKMIGTISEYFRRGISVFLNPEMSYRASAVAEKGEAV
jgi:hypothetical protein